LIFTLIRAVRDHPQVGIFDRFGAILLSGEHGQAFLREERPPADKLQTVR
jgi:hypothetical protein